jgi:hypothetical protein
VLVLLNKTTVTAAALAALALGLAAQEKKKEWKDRAEYDFYDAALKDSNAAARLDSLAKWKRHYPQSDYSDVRLQIYLVTYRQLDRVREAFDTAAEILTDNPNHVVALATIAGNIYLINSPSAADLETAEKTCDYILTNLDTIYGADKRPADTKEADWAKAKPEMKAFAQKTLGWIYWTRKDAERAEVELTKALRLDPTQGQVSYWLASAILAQNKTKPEKQPEALFHYARAASYDGSGSLPANDRKQIQAYLAKAYAQYHGSGDGLEQLIASAKTSVMPGAGFQIPSAGEVLKAQQEAEEAAAQANPMLALWNSIKTELTGDGGADYFEARMKDALVPGGVGGVDKLKGKIVSMTPAGRPKELVLAIQDPNEGDAILKLDGALPGKMQPGSEIEFEGVARAFTKQPFMVTFEVEKTKVLGWTGKNEVSRKSTGAKKSGGG